MSRYLAVLIAFHVAASTLCAQPSYAKQIRPFLTKYCLECHNAKEMKGTLSLETHKAMMEGSDGGAVIVAGNPDKSKLVLLSEGKEKPRMPPPKAKFQPTKDEIKLLRAWVAAGAKDDGADVKVVLPAIKPRVDVLAPVTAMAYEKGNLRIARKNLLTMVNFNPDSFVVKQHKYGRNISAMKGMFIGTNESGESAVYAWQWGATKIDGIGLGRHSDTVLDVAFTRATDKPGKIASAGYDSRINLYTVLPDLGFQTTVLKEHSDAVYGLAFSPDGTLLASVSADRATKVFDVEKGKLLYTLGEATDWLYCVAWSPDGKYLVSGGVDKSIRVYEPTRTGAKLRQSVFAHEGAVLKVVFTSDSKTLYSVGEDRVVKAWDIEKMVERKVYDKQPETVLCLALREDAGQIIVGRYDGIVQLIDMKTGKVAHEFGKTKAEKEKGRKGEREKGSKGQPLFSPLLPFSLSPLLSYTGTKNEVAANNPGNSPTSGQRIALPTSVIGTLDRAGAVHFFRFDAKKGQQLGMRLIAKELKSKIDPVVILSDMSGRILAESYEGDLGFTFAESGSCAVGVRDRDYRGGADFKYRLELGEISVVTAVFPLGMQRGVKGDIHVDGVFLANKVIPMTIDAKARIGEIIPLPIGADILGKAQIVVGEFPEVLGGGTIPVPGTANGRIARDNQKDVWSFNAKKGQRLIVEVHARRLGSRLDSVIEILDQNDQPVPRAVLRSRAKTNVTFRDHDSAQGSIRIDAWSELATNDFLYVGNELMKIKALPTHPDADCNFFAAESKRLGYLDTTPTHHANNTPMYKVSLHPPGTKFPPNGYPVFTLYYRNDDGGPGYGRDSRIAFDPPADGAYKVCIADARGMGGANFGYRLTVRHPKPHFTLRSTPKTPVVSKGGAIPITITAERIDGFDGPISVRVKNLPPGFHVPDTTIEAGTYTTTVAVYADADAKVPDKAAAAILEGSTHVAGLPVAFVGAFDLPKLVEPGDIVTTTAESAVSIVPGQQSKLIVHIERKNGFKGRVPLDVKGLPHGVRVLDIGLNGILVNENETMRTIVIYAESWVPAADRPFVVLARREGKNTEHAAKAVILRVK
jgi:WD40 repeat protein